MTQYLLGLDTELLIAARGLVGPEYAKLIQILGESIVIWGGLVLIWIWLRGTRAHDNSYKQISLQIFFTILCVFGIYGLINFLVPQWRPSPADVVGGIAPLIPHPIDNSFPSGHALFTAALVVGLWKWYRNPTLLSITIILGIITAFSRVIGGVHYPGDILGGWFFGGIGALLLAPLMTKKFFTQGIYPQIIRIAGWFRL